MEATYYSIGVSIIDGSAYNQDGLHYVLSRGVVNSLTTDSRLVMMCLIP